MYSTDLAIFFYVISCHTGAFFPQLGQNKANWKCLFDNGYENKGWGHYCSEEIFVTYCPAEKKIASICSGVHDEN